MTKSTIILTILSIMTFGSLKKYVASNCNESNFAISLNTYNHSENWNNLFYRLENGILTISRKENFSNDEQILFSKKINANSIRKLKLIEIDKLDDFYFNKCVLATSGSEYIISVTNENGNKNVKLHHYYENHIEKLIKELNKSIPKNLKIVYVQNDTKQDCK